MSELTSFGTISLGGLIKLLEQRDQAQSVYFNFCGFVPADLASYRGYYDHLAIDWEQNAAAPRVEVLIAALRAAIGATFDGYKGGIYRMGVDTPLWAAKWGESGSTTILGLADCEYSTVILTGYAP